MLNFKTLCTEESGKLSKRKNQSLFLKYYVYFNLKIIFILSYGKIDLILMLSFGCLLLLTEAYHIHLITQYKRELISILKIIIAAIFIAVITGASGIVLLARLGILSTEILSHIEGGFTAVIIYMILPLCIPLLVLLILFWPLVYMIYRY